MFSPNIQMKRGDIMEHLLIKYKLQLIQKLACNLATFLLTLIYYILNHPAFSFHFGDIGSMITYLYNENIQKIALRIGKAFIY